MSSIHYGTSFLMLVAAAMVGCAAESADMTDGDMDADIESVESSDAALEATDLTEAGMPGAPDPSAAVGPQGAGLGTPPQVGLGVGTQFGSQCPLQKKCAPPSKYCPPPSKFCPPPSKFCQTQYPPAPPQYPSPPQYPQR
ncbi:hypothetical protein WME90_29535 [Sorangium sp. So ce375]|uniref:hypothetical protein n=1 Tax=Sorangium sp. So ce375 TaxID=3133306 RepID=UPI003F5B79D5